MPENKIIFDVNNVDITDIMQQIEENVKKRKYDEEALKKLSEPFEMDVSDFNTISSELIAESVGITRAASDVKYWWEIPAGGGLKGKIRVFGNKIMRKLTFFYLKHVCDQQNIFNSNAANSIEILSGACAELRSENANLQAQIRINFSETEKLKAEIEKISAENQSNLKKCKEVCETQGIQIELLRNSTHAAFEHLDSINTAIAARMHQPTEEQVNVVPKIPTESKNNFDYFLFESKFRGSSEDIRKRQIRYLPYFSGKNNVLDLGCGRGEFLEFLGENGISAKGVDILPENIYCCEKKKLDVTLGDGISYLNSCEDGSLGGIFCAQVIEHLTTNQLIELLKLAHKKLQDGGKILLETLNPQCLMIYAECFYLDPSHTKPVHPLAVQFIAECQGFSSNEILYMTPSDQRLIIPNIPEKPEFDEPVNTINNLIFGNREYALIATK